MTDDGQNFAIGLVVGGIISGFICWQLAEFRATNVGYFKQRGQYWIATEAGVIENDPPVKLEKP